MNGDSKRKIPFKVAIAILFLILSGCALPEGQSRKVTVWGLWATPYALGVGYFHSERGDSEQIKSEESAKPSIVK